MESLGTQVVFSFLPAFEGYNFGEGRGKEMKVNSVRKQDFPFLDQGLQDLVLLGQIQYAGYVDLLGQRLPRSIKKN